MEVAAATFFLSCLGFFFSRFFLAKVISSVPRSFPERVET